MRRGAETKQQIAKRFGRRGAVVAVVFAAIAASLVARAVQLQVLDKDFLNRQADSRHVRSESINAHRGTITDRHGEPIAISTPVDSIWVDPQAIAPAIGRLAELAAELDIDGESLERRITRSMDKEFVWVRRGISPERTRDVLDLGVPGVNVRREYRRFYPHGEVTGHLIGFTDVDDLGQEGIELAYNYWLAGEPGEKRILKDRLGRPVENVESVRPAHHGKQLELSVDLRIQYLAYRMLKAAVRKYSAESGSIVILDVATGEVLAMVNQPAYNPNDRAQFKPDRYRNRAITDIFEPGSSIKPLVVAAALESGRFRPSSVIDTSPGFITVGAKRIEDRRNLGRVSLTTILARSSNVGVTRLAMELEPEHLWQTMTRFGLGELTSSSFPGESTGSLSHHSYWREINQATLAYGYGVSVTPLQLAHAYAALGGDGGMPPVSLLRIDQPVESVPTVHAETAAAVRRMLEEVVRPGGTGTKAAVPGYRVAGKTGTAWKSAVGGYSEDKYISIFAGLAPASAPRLAAVVVIDEPGGELYYGSDVAAPVFADVMAEALRLLAVPPDALPARDAGSVLSAMANDP